MKRNIKDFPKGQKGFSLLEMAIVLLIVGILLGGLMTSMGQSAENAQRTTTTNQLNNIQEALYGFAQANGRLPCPANHSSLGYEIIDTSTAEGDCTAYHGFVPNVSLGLTGRVNGDGLLLDAWGNPLRYSVTSFDTASGGNVRAFTSSAGLSYMFENPADLIAANMLTICDDSTSATTCSNTALADTAPAVIFSMGNNWAIYSSTDEETNSGDGATTLGAYPIHPDTNDYFVSTGYAEDSYDDMIIWLSPYTLYSRLIKSSRLP